MRSQRTCSADMTRAPNYIPGFRPAVEKQINHRQIRLKLRALVVDWMRELEPPMVEARMIHALFIDVIAGTLVREIAVCFGRLAHADEHVGLVTPDLKIPAVQYFGFNPQPHTQQFNQRHVHRSECLPRKFDTFLEGREIFIEERAFAVVGFYRAQVLAFPVIASELRIVDALSEFVLDRDDELGVAYLIAVVPCAGGCLAVADEHEG